MVSFEIESTNERRTILHSLGIVGDVAEEVLLYNKNPFQPSAFPLPLPDEPFVPFWEGIATAKSGIYAALREALSQFAFPVRAGISATREYQAAMRQGDASAHRSEAERLSLNAPAALTVTLYPTLAGRIPVLFTPDREDFVTLVRALSMRHEPKPVPSSMGACLITGMINWGRVREQFAALGGETPTLTWAAFKKQLSSSPERYQDRLMLLSGGDYSAIPAEAMGLTAEQWRTLSQTIRRAHEGTHYVTLRAFGAMRNNLLDEVIADYQGIVAAAGRYRADWWLRFMGLEQYPAYRAGGRFENYWGTPPLSEGAIEALKVLVWRAGITLEAFHDVYAERPPAERLIALIGSTLETLAANDGAARLARYMG
ncbi:MAG TPA: hypothetical protein PLD47_02335 [Aggregatilineales bacterium]|nr:hypothetical protein [Anaerolineales bacterium]HRE46537.1 hypothetical protein [Aggregatilineales bacterium]